MTKVLRVYLYAVVLFPVIAYAQNNRSAVSINGLDTNPCTTVSPCRSFTQAISQTNASGEVIALDSGGYGGFTADRAISILAAPGIYAGVTVASGDAITINAGASSDVVLKNLTINGLGTAHAGISVTGSAAETHIENCVIQNFTTYGIVAFLNVRISDTTIRKTGTGVWIDNAGAAVSGTILNAIIKEMDGGDPASPGTGVLAFRNATVTARNTLVIKATNSGFRALAGTLNLESCIATDNGIGISAANSGTARISNNLVTGNTTGVQNFSSTIETWSNNKVRGNTTDTSGTLTPVTAN